MQYAFTAPELDHIIALLNGVYEIRCLGGQEDDVLHDFIESLDGVVDDEDGSSIVCEDEAFEDEAQVERPNDFFGSLNARRDR
jgi:hypothetical protein